MARYAFGFCPRSSMPVAPDPDTLFLEQAVPENMTCQNQEDTKVTKVSEIHGWKLGWP